MTERTQAQTERLQAFNQQQLEWVTQIKQDPKLKELKTETAFHSLFRSFAPFLPQYQVFTDNELKSDLFEDLRSIALEQVYKTAIDFDLSRNVPYLYYAAPIIRGRFVDHFRKTEIQRKTPVQSSIVKETENFKINNNGKNPSDKQLSKIIDKPIDTIRTKRLDSIQMQPPLSLDSPISNDNGDEETIRYDQIKDPAPPVEELVDIRLYEEIRKHIGQKIIEFVSNHSNILPKDQNLWYEIIDLYLFEDIAYEKFLEIFPAYKNEISESLFYSRIVYFRSRLQKDPKIQQYLEVLK